MKTCIISFFFLFLALNSFSESNYFNYSQSPVKDSLFVKKVENGFKFSFGIQSSSFIYFYEVLPEYKIGWYRKTNRIVGFHPFINAGLVTERYKDVGDTMRTSKTLIFQPGLTLALQYKFINFRLNYVLEHYYRISTSGYDEFGFEQPRYQLAPYTSGEIGVAFSRFDINAELGFGYRMSFGPFYYGTLYMYNGLTLGIRLGK